MNGQVSGQPAQVAKVDVTFDSKQALLQSFELQTPKTHVTGSGGEFVM